MSTRLITLAMPSDVWLAGLVLLLLTAAPTSAQASADYELSWFTIDGGGEMSTVGDDFELSGTIGQPDASTAAMTGGDFELTGGFWAIPLAETEPIPGDLDGDGDVDLTDLAQLLANYGTTEGATYEDGDLDGDGDVDLTDLAILLSHYGESGP